MYGPQNATKIAVAGSFPLEEAEQRAFFRLVREREQEIPDLRFVFAVPNGGGRSKAEAGALKAQGVRRGVPDVCFPFPRGGYAGWWGELKRQNGVPSDLSEEQAQWLLWLREQGHRAGWHKGGLAMFADLMEYLALPEARR